MKKLNDQNSSIIKYPGDGGDRGDNQQINIFSSSKSPKKQKSRKSRLRHRNSSIKHPFGNGNRRRPRRSRIDRKRKHQSRKQRAKRGDEIDPIELYQPKERPIKEEDEEYRQEKSIGMENKGKEESREGINIVNID